MNGRGAEAVGNDRLHSVLARSRSLGFLGPGPIENHLENAAAFTEIVGELSDGDRVLDLGSGGGLPGLVVAAERPNLAVVLLDASEKRCAFLRWAVAELELDGCAVLQGRAEEWARTEHRGTYRVVMARSFGPPPQLVECGAPFLEHGGWVVVSEPPTLESAERWPSDGLRRVGLTRGVRLDRGATVLQRLDLSTACPDAFPRPTKVLARSPLF